MPQPGLSQASNPTAFPSPRSFLPSKKKPPPPAPPTTARTCKPSSASSAIWNSDSFGKSAPRFPDSRPPIKRWLCACHFYPGKMSSLPTPWSKTAGSRSASAPKKNRSPGKAASPCTPPSNSPLAPTIPGWSAGNSPPRPSGMSPSQESPPLSKPVTPTSCPSGNLGQGKAWSWPSVSQKPSTAPPSRSVGAISPPPSAPANAPPPSISPFVAA